MHHLEPENTLDLVILGLQFHTPGRMTDQFSFGGTIRYIEETLDKLKMRGVMIDLGTYYWTGLGSTRFAVAVTNFGNDLAPDGEVVLVGNRTRSQSGNPFHHPQCFRIGFALEPYEDEENKVNDINPA